MPPDLTSKQRRHLRSIGHHLVPVVIVGKDGVSDSLVAAVSQALLDHDLIKVRLGQNVVEDRYVVADTLASLTDAALAQVIGSTMLLYRAHPKEPTIVLP